jgi:tripartite-type tricarboxylate transporter receptor subunit TctC
MNHPLSLPGRSRRAALLGAFAALTLVVAGPSFGQAYPSKPITFIVPFAAGSATDQLARALGQSITEQTKQAVVVDNKAGASGMMAAQQVARAPADGYTVLITTNTTHAANEHLYKKLPYDPVKDFVPVTGLGRGGQVLVVRADSPYKSVADLVADAKKRPGKLTFGSGSSSSRVAGEMLKQLTHTDILHVPYKSNPLAITDLLGGQIDVMFLPIHVALQQIKAGKLKALAISSDKPSPLLPDVPSLSVLKLGNMNVDMWYGVLAPAGTPRPYIERLNKELGEVLALPAVAKAFETQGMTPAPSTPEAFQQTMATDARRWADLIKAQGITAE